MLRNGSNGCASKRCPCRTWINCSYYTDITKQHQRLANKQKKSYIEEYYDTYFKDEEKLADGVANG